MKFTSIDHESRIIRLAGRVQSVLAAAVTPVGSYYSDMLDGYQSAVDQLRDAITEARLALRRGEEVHEDDLRSAISDLLALVCDLDALDVFNR